MIDSHGYYIIVTHPKEAKQWTVSRDQKGCPSRRAPVSGAQLALSRYIREWFRTAEQDGAPEADGADAADRVDRADGTPGANGADGADRADGVFFGGTDAASLQEATSCSVERNGQLGFRRLHCKTVD